jgi:hypothetical protein
VTLSVSIGALRILRFLPLSPRRLRLGSFTLAMNNQARALSMVASKSFAKRRFRLSHAMDRSTTHRRGSGSNPLAASDLLTVSSVHRPSLASA